MDISVMLSTYNRSDILAHTLASFCLLNVSGIRWELLVVDNADDEKTRQTVEKYSSSLPVKYLLETKSGKNNALNRAVSDAQGILYVFTDDDIKADKNWLKELWEGAKRWPEYSVFGGRILPEFSSKKLLISEDHPFFISAYVVADWDIKEGPYGAWGVWGPNMAIRAKIFQNDWRFNTDIGPEGNNYIMGSETEFTERLEEAGIKSVYLPECLVYHQIRLEQLKAKWLFGRAFRYGRQLAQEAGWQDVTLLFGAPRYLLRQQIEISMKRLMYIFNRKERVNLGIKYWELRGKAYQYRRILKKC